MQGTTVLAAKALARAPGPRIWTLADQGLASLGSALTTVLLARHLSPDNFSIAVLIVAVMLFLNTVHASLIVYPLSVFGAPLPRSVFRAFAGRSLESTVIAAVPLALVLFGVARMFASTSAAMWSAITLIAWQLQETARRALFTQLRHREAIPGDCLSYLGQAAIFGVLGTVTALTLPLVFVAMTATSVIGGCVQAASLRPRVAHYSEALRHTREGIRQGRWTLPSNLLGSAIMQAPIWMIALLWARSAAGQFQIMVAVVGVMNPVMYGVANYLTPAVARATSHRPDASSRRLVTSAVTQGAILLAPFVVLVWLWPDQILGLIYGRESSYMTLANSLRILTVAYLLVYLVHVGNSALFGFERPRDVLFVQLAGAIVFVMIGIPLVVEWGVMGAVLATTVAHLTRALVCGRGLGRALRPTPLRQVVAAGSR